MRWGKIVLLFQAVITLFIGIIFFSQFNILEKVDVDELAAQIGSGENYTNNIPPVLLEIKHRYTVAAYTLLVISVIELIIISRLIS
jgi:hypothetical protein